MNESDTTNPPVKLSIFEPLAVMQMEISNWAHRKGWYDIPESPDLYIARSCSNIHGEVSELWEAYRRGQIDEPCDKMPKMVEMGLAPLSNAEEELADILIRVLDISAHLGINLAHAVAHKQAYNESRPYRHNNKLA